MGAAPGAALRHRLLLVAVGGAMTCATGKQAFSAQQAHEKARNASRRYSTGFAAYHCPECGAWHFGHHYSHKTPMLVIRRDQQISKRGTI